MKTKNLTLECLMDNNIVDVRDIIERLEELETILLNRYSQRDTADEITTDPEDVLFNTWLSQNRYDDEQADELIIIRSFLDDLRGNGGDEQWRGEWYPITLIHNNYFEEYARELAEDIGAINRDASWPNNCIDWKQAASELETDYSAVDFGRETFLYR